ncbi:DUF2860 family protein [Veronia pacifica]|uniref:DUF2860 domain-containing protein n=1 Tax=Veronia pacifica TaxID=1080227 RepID=A0A1C3EPC3_9GAMM|nr:DUF2860 family protein [Veronia pacifica]ODA35104.1 hypothetical protein A8L45_05350 [Veronia pacifica]
MKKSIWKYSLTGLVAIVSCSSSAKQDNREDGFGGHIGVFVAYQSSTSNFNTENTVTTGDPEASQQVFAGPPVELHYNWDQQQVYLSLFNSNELIQLGYQTKIGDSSAGLNYRPSLFGNEAFADPYPLKQVRDTTDTKAHSFDLWGKNILGTPLSLTATYHQFNVENDKAGSTLGIQEQQVLKRSADSLTLASGIEFPVSLANKIFASVELSFEQYRADGDAETFDGKGASVGLFKPLDNQFVMLKFGYQTNEFKTLHPIFGKTRDDDIVDASFIYTLDSPFGWHDTSLAVNASYSDNMSNIDFFEQQNLTVGTGIIYHF